MCRDSLTQRWVRGRGRVATNRLEPHLGGGGDKKKLLVSHVRNVTILTWRHVKAFRTNVYIILTFHKSSLIPDFLYRVFFDSVLCKRLLLRHAISPRGGRRDEPKKLLRKTLFLSPPPHGILFCTLGRCFGGVQCTALMKWPYIS